MGVYCIYLIIYLYKNKLISLISIPIYICYRTTWIYYDTFIMDIEHVHIYIYIILYILYIYNVADRNKEGEAEGKRFNQMIAKWLDRTLFGWGTLYLASRVLGAQY